MTVLPGKLIVISAPSGTGKTTIVERLLARNKNLKRSISYTTRAPRGSEKNGTDYVFVSDQEFKTKQRAHFFLESATVFGASYGTSREAVESELAKGFGVVLAIDVQGMKQVKERAAGELPMISIFVMPPSLEELKARLAKRKTESAGKMKERLQVAETEMEERTHYDFQVVNEHLEQAVGEIEEILRR
jgi:guanylate kinase